MLQNIIPQITPTMDRKQALFFFERTPPQKIGEIINIRIKYLNKLIEDTNNRTNKLIEDTNNRTKKTIDEYKTKINIINRDKPISTQITGNTKTK